MKSEYQLNSANDLKPEIVESIKLAFGNTPIKITIEDMRSKNSAAGNASQKYPKELTDTVIDLIFDQLSKKKK